jgi:hypothetical protein
MSLTVTELAGHVERSNDRLTAAIDKLSTRFDDFRSDVSAKLGAINNSLAFVKWVGTVLASVAIGALGITSTAAYRAGETGKTIVVLERAMLESQQEAKARDVQIAKMLATLQAIETDRKTTVAPVTHPQ